MAGERERIERALLDERERWRLTLASIDDAVIATDADARVTLLNSVAQALTGWSELDAVGRPLTEVFRVLDDERRLVARDGSERLIADTQSPLHDSDGAVIGMVVFFRDITEQRVAERGLVQLAAIVETSDDAIVSKTLDGVIRSWNAAATRLFGYSPEEAIGQPITLIIPPDRRAEETALIEQLRRGERIDHFETVRVSKDGRSIDISLSVSPMFDKHGRVIGASKIARDITERRIADERLRQSDAHDRFLAELASATQSLGDPDVIMATTARMLAEHMRVDRCVYANVEDESVFVIVGEHTRGVPSIVGRWPIGAECTRAMRADESFIVADVDQDPRVGPDLGAYRAANIRSMICVPLHKGGKLTAAMAVHQNTPRQFSTGELDLVRTALWRAWESLERARAERALRDTADHLALALDSANLGNWSWDLASDKVNMSPRGATMFNIEPGPSMTWNEMQSHLHADDRERIRLAVLHAVQTRTAYDVEYRVHRPGGGQLLWVSAKGRAQYAADGQPLGMFGIVQDITERKRLEQELQQRAAELAEADRKKDDFIALLAHELRNPLAPVRTGLQVMRLAGDDAASTAKTLAMMDRQMTHMVRMIDDLLDVSRVNRGKLHLQRADVALSDVVSHAVEAAIAAIEESGHQLEVELPPDPVMLDGDLTRLAQVFGNLLTNSAKFTEQPGRISLTARVEGDTVVIAVQDSGVGIAAEMLPHVFEMFAQGDRSLERKTGGLGIGLGLVRGLVEMHGGTVTATSPGLRAGATFTVRLPIARKLRQTSPEPTEATAPPAGRTVLVVDDNEDGADSLAMLLDLLGHRVHVARDGVEAVELAERVRPDLVLMDIGMPRMNGLEATQRIREQAWSRTTTIIALTGWGQSNDRDRSRSAGCDGHLVKPVSLPELEKVLAALPGRGDNRVES